MKVVSLRQSSFPVPFRNTFKHASARRGRAENVIVIAQSESGQVGVGEGCPRDYVTGETTTTAQAFLDRHMPSVTREIGDLESLRRWIDAHEREIDRNPAAFCALELALLELFAKDRGESLEALLELPALSGTCRYTAVLGDSPAPVYWLQLRRYWSSGFRDYKVKLSGDLRRDRWKLKRLRARGEAARIRLDANNLWQEPRDCIAHLNSLSAGFFAVEEPLAQNDIAGCARVSEALGVKIVLDESFLRADQLDAISNEPERWILNCRVSKLGGLVRSLRVARAAAERGLGIIIGAQVGETSILTRAGLALGQGVVGSPIAREGAFGTYLLKRDLTPQPLQFGVGGILSPDCLLDVDAPGFGFPIRKAVMEAFAPAGRA